MKNLLILTISLLSLQTSVAQRIVKGVVFVDKNQNSLFERGEHVAKSAAVTNGDTVVWCDRRGRYTIDVSEDDYLSVILPDGYTSPGVEAQNGAMHFVGKSRSEINFPLIQHQKSKNYRFAIIGDPQVDNEQQFTYAQMSMSEIASRKDLDGAIIMGDLVNDNIEDLPQFSSLIKEMPQPTWSIIGNHDITKERTNSAFIKSIGADVTAFFRGTTCFVLINNVEGKSRSEINPSTLRFLRQMADYVADDSLLVICQHIPLAHHREREAVLSILGEQKTLILSAHAHTIFRKRWSDKIAEVSVGALCGHWWTGERGTDGVPLALQQCGTPPNYFLFDITDDGYQFNVETIARRRAGELYWYSDIDFDKSIETLSNIPPRSLIANIYASSNEYTRVEWSLDGTQWHTMAHTEMISPNVARLIYLNKEGDYPSNVSRRQPMRKLKSQQIWSANLPATLTPGAHTIKVRATDNGGLRNINLQRIIYIEP